MRMFGTCSIKASARVISLFVLLALFPEISALAQTPSANTPIRREQENMRQAIQHIRNHDYTLARNYLDAIVISPGISNTQRSRGYYFRGYSFYSQKMYVSAAQDYARSLEFDPGNETTLAATAHLYAQGMGVKRNPAVSFELSLKAARAGHQISQYRVGRAYLEAHGVGHDLKKARYWLKTSAAESYAPALVQLAASYRLPVAPEPDTTLAESIYQQALAAGSTDALVGLAYMHLNGELVNQDGEKPDLALAADYFRRAAGAGSPTGQAGLGYMYQSGQGLEKNIELANHWFDRAAKSGNTFAQMQLAEFSLKTPSLKNTKIALAWLKQAARQGATSAQNSLAWLLATSKYAELRNGKQAVSIAEAVVANNTGANYLDTLAAAFAENGDFEQAEIVQKKAIAVLNNPERSASANFDKRLLAYQSGKAWRE